MRVLVTGAAGFFGFNVCRRHADRFELVTAWHLERPQHPGAESLHVDLADPASVDALWHAARPQAVLHLGGMTAVADCETNPPAAERVNVDATRQLAQLASASGARLVFTSTDLVFDGTEPPYTEDDPPTPISTYGRTKAAAERAVLETDPAHLVCRVALAYGPNGDGTIRQVQWILDQARSGAVTLFIDEYRTPIDSITLADCLAELLRHDAGGVVHLAGTERISRYEFARRLLPRAGLDPDLARSARVADSPIPRSADTTLEISRARRLLTTPLLDVDAGLDRVLPAV